LINNIKNIVYIYTDTKTMTSILPSSFTHALKTCEGYVSKRTDEDGKLVDKNRLTKHANWIFTGKADYNNFTTTNAVVIQLDGNYFVADTDDEESDAFIIDIMTKYGVTDNVTPSLSNYLLGKKNKNHYWFVLPDDIRWRCMANYTKGRIQSDASKLDLLGSKNRIMFENKECLHRLKNIPMMSQEMMNDICDFVPKALLGEQLNFEKVTKTKIEPKAPKENIMMNNYFTKGFGVAWTPEVKKFIDENTRAEDAATYQSWSVVLTKIANKYGKTQLGMNAAHYFSSKHESYDRNGVNEFYNKIDLSKESIQEYKFWNCIERGKCIIQLDDEDMSEASTAVNSVVSTEDEVEEDVVVVKASVVKPSVENMIIGANEDKNFTTICDKIVPSIRKVLLYCREEWYTYDDTTHLWSVIKEPQKIIKKYMFKCIADNNKDVAIRLTKVAENDVSTRAILVDLQKKYLNLYTKIESLQNITLVKRDLMVSLCDDEFVNKLNQHEGKLVFKDGIYDIAADVFTAGLKYEHYLTYTLPYKYRKAAALDKAEVTKKVMEICANDPWRYNYYMEILGYSMLGMPDKEQVAFFMVGMSAGNGKSTLLEALTQMMPNYVVNLNSKTFSVGNTDFKKSINSVKGARIAWINEVQKVKQDIDMIKQIADGKAINNPVLFKQKEELIKILAKLFFVSNGELKFASDEGIKRRYRYVEFIAKFYPQQEYDALEEKRDIDFVADTAFAELLVTENGFFALLEIICEGSRRWITNKGLIVPDAYLKLAKAACEKNDEFAEFVANNIVKSTDFVSRFEIEERYKLKYSVSKMPNEKTEFRAYMATKGFAYECLKKKRVNGTQRDGCYMNCKLTEENDEEE
jgi:hypothetical protein